MRLVRLVVVVVVSTICRLLWGGEGRTGKVGSQSLGLAVIRGLEAGGWQPCGRGKSAATMQGVQVKCPDGILWESISFPLPASVCTSCGLHGNSPEDHTHLSYRDDGATAIAGRGFFFPFPSSPNIPFPASPFVVVSSWLRFPGPGNTVTGPDRDFLTVGGGAPSGVIPSYLSLPASPPIPCIHACPVNCRHEVEREPKSPSPSTLPTRTWFPATAKGGKAEWQKGTRGAKAGHPSREPPHFWYCR